MLLLNASAAVPLGGPPSMALLNWAYRAVPKAQDPLGAAGIATAILLIIVLP